MLFTSISVFRRNQLPNLTLFKAFTFIKISQKCTFLFSENTIDEILLLISLSGLVLYYAFVILTTTTGVLFLEEEPIHQNTKATAMSIVFAFCNIFQVSYIYSFAFCTIYQVIFTHFSQVLIIL